MGRADEKLPVSAASAEAATLRVASRTAAAVAGAQGQAAQGAGAGPARAGGAVAGGQAAQVPKEGAAREEGKVEESQVAQGSRPDSTWPKAGTAAGGGEVVRDAAPREAMVSQLKPAAAAAAAWEGVVTGELQDEQADEGRITSLGAWAVWAHHDPALLAPEAVPDLSSEAVQVSWHCAQMC